MRRLFRLSNNGSENFAAQMGVTSTVVEKRRETFIVSWLRERNDSNAKQIISCKEERIDKKHEFEVVAWCYSYLEVGDEFVVGYGARAENWWVER